MSITDNYWVLWNEEKKCTGFIRNFKTYYDIFRQGKNNGVQIYPESIMRQYGSFDPFEWITLTEYLTIQQDNDRSEQ